MGIRTGAQVLEGLRDGRQLYMDGTLVKDVTKDPRLSGGARTMAQLYDMQNQPELRDEMTYESPKTGERVGMSFLQARTREDLARKRGMYRRWHDHTLGMFGRAPDFVNVMLSSFAAGAEAFGPYAKNMTAYYEKARDEDRIATHSLTNPQVDRTHNVAAQAKDLAAKAVRETDAGIVIRGARMLATLGAYSDDLLVMPAPSYPLPNTEEAKAFAIGFTIPVATKGVKLINRPGSIAPGVGSSHDFPLSARFDESDCMIVFDDVLVPWENVLMYRDVEIFNSIYKRVNATSAMGHQFAIKDLCKAEFMMGLAFSLVRTTKVDEFLHIQGMLAELINSVQVLRSCILTGEQEAQISQVGVMAPAMGPIGAVRYLFPEMFRRSCEIIQIIGAGGLAMVPSFAEVHGPLAEDVKTYYQAAAADSSTRIRLFRLAVDAAMSTFSGRQQLYERYFAGDPVRGAGNLYQGFDKEPHVARIKALLERFEREDAAGL